MIGKSGDITLEEARKRLKRWLVIGTKFNTEVDPMQERQSHVSFGGNQLKDLASDVAGWSELDDDLDVLVATLP